MRITNITINNFRSFREISDISIENDITILLGRNESGKSNFLRALEWFSTSEPLEEEEKCSYEEPNLESSVSLKFNLESDEEKNFMNQFMIQPTKSTELTVIKFGNGVKQIFLNNKKIEIKPTINSILTRITELINFATKQTSLQPIDDSILKNLIEFRKIKFSKILNPKDSENGIITKEENTNGSGETNKVIDDTIAKLMVQPFQNPSIEKERQVLVKELTYLKSTGKEQDDHTFFLKTSLPRMVYFSDVEKIEDTIKISAFDPNNSKFKTFSNLADLAGLNIKKLTKNALIKRQRETIQASTRITGLIDDSWQQESLMVKINADGDNLLVLIDDNVSFEPPSRRSEGFQYFFSFYINFMAESKSTLKNSIILLDDPGVHLHPAGQKDLLSTMEKIAKNNQIIIVTHSPFFIDKYKFSRIRIVEKKEREGTKILEKIYMSDYDAFEPIRTAIGTTIGDSLFTSPFTVMVEGVSDFLILNSLMVYLQNINKIKYVNGKMGIFPVQGATKIPYFATIYEKERFKYFILLDNDKSGKKVKKDLEDNGFINSERVHILSDIISTDLVYDYEIEDLLPKEFYLIQVKEAYSDLGFDLSELTKEYLNETDSKSYKITKKIQRFFSEKELGDFDKIMVAKTITITLATLATKNDVKKVEKEFKNLIEILMYIDSFFGKLLS